MLFRSGCSFVVSRTDVAGSPQTNNPCITFQVLKDIYSSCIGVNSSNEETYSGLQKKLYSQCTYFQTTQVLAQLSPAFQPANKPVSGSNESTKTTLGNKVTELKPNSTFHTGNNPVFGMCSYKPTENILKAANSWFWDNLTKIGRAHV